MLTALLPKSRTHAYTQLTTCFLLFYACPSLVPSWRCFPLTIITAGALLLVPLRVPSLTLPKRCCLDTTRWVRSVYSILAQLACAILYALLACARNCLLFSADSSQACCRAAKTIARNAAGTFSLWTESLIYTARIRFLPLLSKITLLCAHISQHLHRTIITYIRLTTSNVQKPSLQISLNLHSTRYFIALILWAMYVPFAILARQTRRLIWLLVMLAHFLSFTLGLALVFPCLCLYGVVVVFMQQVVIDGITGF